MIGGGKYEKEVEALLRNEDAELAVIIVVGGNRGSGFSLAVVPSAAQQLDIIANVLHDTADEIKKDFTSMVKQPLQ